MHYLQRETERYADEIKRKVMGSLTKNNRWGYRLVKRGGFMIRDGLGNKILMTITLNRITLKEKGKEDDDSEDAFKERPPIILLDLYLLPKNNEPTLPINKVVSTIVQSLESYGDWISAHPHKV